MHVQFIIEGDYIPRVKSSENVESENAAELVTELNGDGRHSTWAAVINNQIWLRAVRSSFACSAVAFLVPASTIGGGLKVNPVDLELD